MSKDIDFARISDASRASVESLALKWLPDLKRAGSQLACNCPFHNEKSPSFKIDINKGTWKCFGCGAGGSDMIALYAELNGLKMSEAAIHIGELLTVGIVERIAPAMDGRSRKPANEDWTPIIPAPTEQRPSMNHKRYGKPVAMWAYRNADGGLIGYTARFEFKKEDGSTGKDVMPITFAKHKDGHTGWRYLSFPKPRPIYGMELLAAAPNSGVLIVEGEKTADAARTISPGIVITWPGGGKAVPYVDWSPLKGRKVLIWPDQDLKRWTESDAEKQLIPAGSQVGDLWPEAKQPGMSAALAIQKALDGIAESVRIITPPSSPVDGWDLADAVAEGWDRARLVAHLKPPRAPEPEPYPHEPPPGWDAPPVDFEPPAEMAPPPTHHRHDDRLADLPFRILGVDGDAFFYMPDRGHQIVSLSASAHSKPNLMRLAPLQVWEAEYASKSGADWDCAVNALIQRSQSMPKFDPRRIRGRGCWIDGQDVVFHAGDRLVVNGREAEIPDYRSSVRAIYEGALEIPVDSVEVATNAQAAKVIELCELLSWERPLYGKLLAGWLALAPVCGALTWRPHLWVTGPSGSGKSWTVANIIQPLVGKTAVHVQGNTSEAGIRGQLGSDALPVVFDEAESEDRASQMRFDKVLELARQASTETGAGIVKGTASGGSVTYLIRSCFLFASIGVAAVKKADTSRVTVLPLRKNVGPGSQSQFEKIKALWRETLCTDGYAERIRSRSLRYAKIIRINAETFSSVAVEFTGDKRSADQIGTLLAGAYSLTATKEITKEAAREWMAKQDWTGFKSEEVDNDENQCLAHLFAAALKFELQGRNVTRSVSEIVQEILEIPEYPALESDQKRKEELLRTLIRHGMKLTDEGLYVANRHQALEDVFADTPWSGAKWRLQIERVPGASAVKTMAFGTHIKQRAVLVPVV